MPILLLARGLGAGLHTRDCHWTGRQLQPIDNDYALPSNPDMENPIPTPQGSSFDLGDIYYTVFRHKWKILLCALLGFAAALAVYKLRPAPYQSEARLFIRYVLTEGKTLGLGAEDAVTKSPDQRGETIISSELEILTSLDLAQEVARAVGAEKILVGFDGEKDLSTAAAVLRNGLKVEVPTRSSVIRVSYEHSNAEVVQPVLRELVASYLKKHAEVHRSRGMVGDFLTQETDQLRAKLAQTEEELRRVTNRAGIISLEDYKKSTADQLARLREDSFDLQAELAERISVHEQLTKALAAAATPAAEQEAKPPPEKIEAYQRVASRVSVLQQREQEALGQYTQENPWVQSIRARLTEAEQQKRDLEAEFPALARVQLPGAAGTTRPANAYDPAIESARIIALQARLKTLGEQMESIRAEAAKVDQLEVSILELRRRRDMEEANFRRYSASQEQSRINEALGTGRVSNISVVQTPTPPFRDRSKTNKLLAGLAASGLGLGIVWAFAIEMFLDRSIRRPADVERTLRLPLFLSIPRVGNEKSDRRMLANPKALTAGAPGSANDAALMPGGNGTLDAFHETLRDRLISYFDSINLRHKPKLIAVTGLGRESGVTTIAAGLARSFSETGEGNVLLVDMTQGQGSAQHFHHGAPVGIDQLLETRDSAQVQDNLYVVTESSNSERLAKGMPQRFNQLIPKLKASDFDYIIFDMPTVNQISITPRLASFMDMMLMVVESEKTDREIAAHASELLAKSKTPVGVVLNKAKAYIPARLHHDREFLLGT